MDGVKIVEKLIEHDEQFVQVRSEMGQFRDEVNQRLDDIIVILKRLDQERIFTTEWIKRIEGKVEKHDTDIKKIKQNFK